jgi:hypothetical protein
VDARVTLTDVTKKPVVVATGLRLQLRYLDRAKASTPDEMAFAIWRSDGRLIAGTRWDGTQMLGSTLASGQINIKS